MTEREIKHPPKLIKLSRGTGFQSSTLVFMVIGLTGISIILTALVKSIVDDPVFLFLLIPGMVLSFLLLPGLYRTGFELDPVNKRFRSYDGTLGRNKDAWIEVDEGDYLSIVGFSQSRSSNRHFSRRIHVAMSKVYYWSGDWHTEVYKGYYEGAEKYAQKFADVFGLLINDVNKEQDLPEVSQRGFSGYRPSSF